MQIKENIKRGFKDIVDLLIFLVVVIIAILDLGFDYSFQGVYAFFAVYIFSLIYRIGFFKNALNKYVTDKEFREKLKLP